MPKQLKPEQQVIHMLTSLDGLQCSDTEAEVMLERVVASDETKSMTTRASMQWKHKDSLTPTKFNSLTPTVVIMVQL